jgi:hypothetical protein
MVKTLSEKTQKMPMKIRISTESIGSIEAKLSKENPETAKTIYESLPITGFANLWGDEIYFSIPVQIPAENPKNVVDLGDLAYWPPGNAFCIFYGPTPMSRGNEIRPASAVNVFGKISGDPRIFKKVRNGEKIIIQHAI